MLAKEGGGVDNIGYIVSAGNGLESFVYREIEYLIKQNVKVKIFTTKYKKGDVYSPKQSWPTFHLSKVKLILLLPALVIALIARHKLFLEALKSNSVVDLVFAIFFSFHMKRQGVEKIHCHFGDHKLFVGYYCKKILGLPLSVTIHSHELHVNPNEVMFKKAILACDKVFAISNLAVTILVDRYGVIPERVMLSRLCVDASDWKPEKPFRVLTVARFQPQKGFDDLFEAAKILSDYEIEFIVVGFGPMDVRSLAIEKGVQDKVIFFDKMNCQQLQFLYQCVDLYCLPSITHPEQGKEGIPVVLMEAMASGLPVVATNCGAVNEIVTTAIVEESSPEQLARAILGYANSESLRLSDGEANRLKVTDEYSLNNIEIFSSNLLR